MQREQSSSDEEGRDCSSPRTHRGRAVLRQHSGHSGAMPAATTGRRGPGLGGPCLGISPDSSQTRGSVPIADRPSVHCVPVIAGSLKLMELEGSVKERSQTRIALAQEWYHSAAHGDVERTPKKRRSDRDLQVIDLKAAAALSCSYMIGTDHAGSHTITVARTCMHHAPSRGCCQASLAVGEGWQTDMDPSTARDGTVSDDARHQTCTYGSCEMQREQRCGNAEGREC